MNAHAPPSASSRGIYPLSEAARLAQLPAQTARRWSVGYAFSYRGETRRSAGVVALAMPPIGKQVDLTFAEMLTLRLVKGFKDAGLSLRTIKLVAQAAARDFGTPTPFVTRRFRTDGRRVFLELRGQAEAIEKTEIAPRDRELIEVLSGQRQFADVVEPSLYAKVEWTDDIATRWWPLGTDRAVVLDPAVMFGAPRVRESRLSTADLAAAVRAEGGGEAAIAAVAEWYDLPAAEVRDALEFETEWLRRAA